MFTHLCILMLLWSINLPGKWFYFTADNVNYLFKVRVFLYCTYQIVIMRPAVAALSWFTRRLNNVHFSSENITRCRVYEHHQLVESQDLREPRSSGCDQISFISMEVRIISQWIQELSIKTFQQYVGDCNPYWIINQSWHFEEKKKWYMSLERCRHSTLSLDCFSAWFYPGHI